MKFAITHYKRKIEKVVEYSSTFHRVGSYATKLCNRALNSLCSNTGTRYSYYRMCSDMLHYRKYSCKCAVHTIEYVLGVFQEFFLFTYSKAPWWLTQRSSPEKNPCNMYGKRNESTW